jgi:predicted Ser/Thr protein kinase
MDDIFRRLDEHHQKHRVSHWAGPFCDYLPMTLKNSQLAQLAHARIYNMVRSYGVDIEVVDTLVRKEGYCVECANELLRYVSSLLAREK